MDEIVVEVLGLAPAKGVMNDQLPAAQDHVPMGRERPACPRMRSNGAAPPLRSTMQLDRLRKCCDFLDRCRDLAGTCPFLQIAIGAP